MNSASRTKLIYQEGPTNSPPGNAEIKMSTLRQKSGGSRLGLRKRDGGVRICCQTYEAQWPMHTSVVAKSVAKDGLRQKEACWHVLRVIRATEGLRLVQELRCSLPQTGRLSGNNGKIQNQYNCKNDKIQKQYKTNTKSTPNPLILY